LGGCDSVTGGIQQTQKFSEVGVKSVSVDDMQDVFVDAGMDTLRAAVKAKLRPKAEKRGIPWAPVDCAIDKVDTREELEAALVDPDAFFEELILSLALEIAIAKALEQLQPLCERRGVPFSALEKCARASA
jgi:hypothetical protein